MNSKYLNQLKKKIENLWDKYSNTFLFILIIELFTQDSFFS